MALSRFGRVVQSLGEINTVTKTLHQAAASTSVGQVPMDRLRSVFDGMFDGVWLVGADGRTTYAAGHRVLAASDAEQALRASERWSERIDVLVTDVVMPGIHGTELAARIVASRPDIGVVFVSGYDEDAVGRGTERTAVGDFLPKPFTVDALRRAVDRAGDKARPALL